MKSSGVEASGAEHHACAVCDQMGELTHEPWRNTKSSGMEASEALMRFVTTTGELTHKPFLMGECERHPMEKYKKLWRGGIRS